MLWRLNWASVENRHCAVSVGRALPAPLNHRRTRGSGLIKYWRLAKYAQGRRETQMSTDTKPGRPQRLPWSVLLSTLSLLVAVGSLGVSYIGLNYQRTSLDNERISRLLSERVEACARQYSLSEELISAAGGIAFLWNQEPPTSPERIRRRIMIDNALNDFERGSRLAMLGPDELLRAEDALRQKLNDVQMKSIAGSQSSEQQLTAATSAAESARAAFRDACVRAVGAYRQGPSQANTNHGMPQ